MLALTSLAAQSQFGHLIDTSQREPVVITRHGRPVSIVLSATTDVFTMSYELKKIHSQLNPLRGQAAVNAFNRVTAPIGEHNRQLGLTEEALEQLLNEK
jgi:prevent-host-death family protein